MARIAITGASGFIGKALIEALHKDDQRHTVIMLNGDVRDPASFSPLDHTFDYLFHFGAPSSQTMFKRNPSQSIEVTVKGTMNAATAAAQHGIRLVYPSTGLLSSGRYNEYALGKKIMEDYIKGLNIDAIGIRIFASYGPGEGHKRDYASVPYLLARAGFDIQAPVIYGDGSQSRDLIFIKDTVAGIIAIAKLGVTGIVDLGSGVPVSFNDLYDKIRTELKLYQITAPDPIYVDSPVGYVDKTVAKPNEFYTPGYSVEQGIAALIKSFYEENK